MHLGDILHYNGGNIISQNINMPKKINIQWFEENILRFRSNCVTQKLFALLDDQYTKSVQDRIKSGTYENFLKYKLFLQQMSNRYFKNDRVYFACMPVAPYVNFEDLIIWNSKDSTILPFTSIDPNISINDACYKVSSQMYKAYGLKLHPIIQGIPFNSKRTFKVLESIEKFNKPVLLHTGSSRYYLGDEREKQHLELDDIKSAKEMIRTFPNVIFILGHAGCSEVVDWTNEFSPFENVFIDITVQSKNSIRFLINRYGEDRILFGSDWPCIDPRITLKIIINTLTEKQQEKCFFRNASNLLKIN